MVEAVDDDYKTFKFEDASWRTERPVQARNLCVARRCSGVCRGQRGRLQPL